MLYIGCAADHERLKFRANWDQFIKAGEIQSLGQGRSSNIKPISITKLICEGPSAVFLKT